ncbi:MAG TPA: lytic transglycosylase domain-containing protein [Candidatus Binatia bacterium]|nr:lytic transglycosylase domain-containing protein [Candidatus Binatia bacterium]
MLLLARFSLLSLFLSWMLAQSVPAQGHPFAVPAGLETAVEFWKRIFTRYSFGEVVFFDPVDPATIYAVVRAPENEQGRALIESEKARVVAGHDIADEETRIRSQRGAKEHFAEGLRISGRYIGEMKKIFREEGLPEQLAYLPLVESSFNIRARSVAGALGMWQFMPETGKKFMRIDRSVDERRDPMASTRAAARLLKQNYRLFDNKWPLAITAYNHGTEGIFRGVQAAESDDLVELIKRYQSPSFGFASKNFYAEFLAVVEIATKRDEYFPFLRPHAPVLLREVEVKRPASLHGVLKPAAISHNDFFDWNPALDTDIKAIPAGYRVKLPAHKLGAFVAALRRVSSAVVKKARPTGKSGAVKVQSRQTSSGTTSKSVPRKPKTVKPPPSQVRAPVKTAS